MRYEELLTEMANLYSDDTGLPFDKIHLHPKTPDLPHDIRIKIYKGGKVIAVVGLRPKVEVKKGNLSGTDEYYLKKFLSLGNNLDLIIQYSLNNASRIDLLTNLT